MQAFLDREVNGRLRVNAGFLAWLKFYATSHSPRFVHIKMLLSPVQLARDS